MTAETPSAPPRSTLGLQLTALGTLFAALIFDLVSKSITFQPAKGFENLAGIELLIHLNELWKDWAWVEPRVNTGVAWSVLSDQPMVVIGLTLVLIPILTAVYWLSFRKSGFWSDHVGWGCILGGALGNAVDRARVLFPNDPIGGVRDFIHVDLHWFGIPYVWPTFNIADSAIFVGFVLVFAPTFWRKTPSKPGEEISEVPVTADGAPPGTSTNKS